MQFTLAALEYMPKLDGDATVGVSCVVKVQETEQVFTAQDKVVVDLPELSVKVSPRGQGQNLSVKVRTQGRGQSSSMTFNQLRPMRNLLKFDAMKSI